MTTKKELKDFAEFCFYNYGLEIHGFIIEGYIKSVSSGSKSETQSKSNKLHHETECGTNNVKCVHISFDSVKCNVCPY